MEAMITPNKFGREVAKYDPITLVQMCAYSSKELEKSGQTMQEGTLNGQNVIVAHHGLATVAMWAIRNHPWAAKKTPSSEDVTRLANNVYSLEDPYLGTSSGGLMTLVRTAYDQFPYYQEDLRNLIPRHLILLLETAPSEPPLNPDSALLKATGLSVKEFMVIGIVSYSLALAHHTFERTALERTTVESLKPYLSPEKIDAFLKIAGANLYAFRDLRLDEEKAARGLAARYIFNPLVARPVVVLPHGQLCLPVPRLMVHRFTAGIYYDLLSMYRQPQGNPFADWFGHAFQEYIGKILQAAFGQERVHTEPLYGRPEIAGPDWVVFDNETALVFECRSGRPSQRVRSQAERDDMLQVINRNITEPVKKLPQKIDDLRNGRTGIKVPPEVREYLPVVVTYAPWLPEALTVDLVQKELAESSGGVQFDLMSAEDLELLLAWKPYETPVTVLKEKRDDPEGKDGSVGQYVGIRARRKGVKQLPRPLLSAKQEEFFSQLIPP